MTMPEQKPASVEGKLRAALSELYRRAASTTDRKSFEELDQDRDKIVKLLNDQAKPGFVEPDPPPWYQKRYLENEVAALEEEGATGDRLLRARAALVELKDVAPPPQETTKTSVTTRKPPPPPPDDGGQAPGEVLTAAQHAGQGFLAGYGDEIMGPVGEMAGRMYVSAGRALGAFPPETDIGREYASGQEPPLDPGDAIRRELAAGKKANPVAAVGGDIAGSGLRYAAAAMTPAGKALEKAPALAKFGAGLVAGVAEPALRQSGDAPSGERLAAAGKGALSAVDSPTSAALTVGGAALGPFAGKVGMADPKLARKQALEARLLAAGFRPNMISILKDQMRDEFYDWAQRFEAAGFHNAPQSAVGRALNLHRPTSARYAGERAADARRAGEHHLDLVSNEASSLGVTVDNESLWKEMEARAKRLATSTEQSEVAESSLWQEAADLIKSKRQKEFVETPRVPSSNRVRLGYRAAYSPLALPPLAPGAKIRSPSSGQKPYVGVAEDLAHPGIMKPDPQRRETMRMVTDLRTEREPFADALRQKQKAGQRGHDKLMERKSAEAAVARLEASLRKEQLAAALPPDLQHRFERANDLYHLGKAGEDAANTGVVSLEFQDPRQIMRDVDRLAINLDAGEKAGGPIAQMIRDHLVSQYGRDMRARWIADTAQRAEANRFGRVANMTRNLAPGANAELIAREIERQKLERQGAAGAK